MSQTKDELFEPLTTGRRNGETVTERLQKLSEHRRYVLTFCQARLSYKRPGSVIPDASVVGSVINLTSKDEVETGHDLKIQTEDGLEYHLRPQPEKPSGSRWTVIGPTGRAGTLTELRVGRDVE